MSDYVIPNTVTSVQSMFSDCSNLTVAPTFPSSVTNMSSTFYNCTKLINAPEIPDNVTNLQSTFLNCSALVKAPSKIPNSVTEMKYTFKSCTALTVLPDMSEATNVSSLYETFYACYSITDLSNFVIPNGVMDSSRKSLTSIEKPCSLS